MSLPFLDRKEELSRLATLLRREEGALAVVYGRRRCGKSRLLREALPSRGAVYYVGDDREGTLQRTALAGEIARLIPDFDRVSYPQWDALFARWWSEAPRGSVLVLDEFPALVAVAREVPSLLQKHIDARRARGVHLVLCGSSQRMMQGLILDRTAPLYGRASEILRLDALPAGWIGRALALADAPSAVEAYAVWGGVPWYWELAAGRQDLWDAIRSLVLSPLGVLHQEPPRLLLDDLRELTQAASILSLIGVGCHRPSEVAGRLGKPVTSLSRPLQRLLELRLVQREVPFGAAARESKRALYRISDPFLRFWFTFVEPARSRLEARRIASVEAEVRLGFPRHVGGVWEALARESAARILCHGRAWQTAARWWGAGKDRRPMEIDLVAEAEDGKAILLGEVSWSRKADPRRLLASLCEKAAQFPLAGDKELLLGLWLRDRPRKPVGVPVVTADQVLRALR